VDVEGAASALVANGHFLEFMPASEIEACRAGKMNTLLMDQLRVGQSYGVVVTNSAGLYRYDMHDVIEVVGKKGTLPLVVFRHKAGTMASLTGEKLGESHVVNAMKSATANADLVPEGFATAPLMPANDGDDEPPAYLLALDLGDAQVEDSACDALAAAFDAGLKAANEEYAGKRDSLRLGAVTWARLPPHAVLNHRKKRVDAGAPDAHVKVPHLSPDGTLLIDLGLGDKHAELLPRLPVRCMP
jgi:hypothetical protein